MLKSFFFVFENAKKKASRLCKMHSLLIFGTIPSPTSENQTKLNARVRITQAAAIHLVDVARI